MAWKGKAIGVAIGAGIGGPGGALLGGWVGHFFDKIKEDDVVPPTPEQPRQAGVEIIMVSFGIFLVRFALLIKKNDPTSGKVLKVLVNAVTKPGAMLGHPNPESFASEIVFRQFKREIERENWNLHPEDNEAVSSLMNLSKSDDSARRYLMFRLCQIVVAFGNVSEERMAMTLAVIAEMGVQEQDFYSTIMFFCRPPEDDVGEERIAQTLGIPKNSTVEEAKCAFRKLAIKYHPDKHHSLPPEIRKLAEEKFSIVRQAFEQFLENRKPKVYYALLTKEGMISTVKNGDVVSCINCPKRFVIRDASFLAESRCNSCHALLAHPGDITEILLKVREARGGNNRLFY